MRKGGHEGRTRKGVGTDKDEVREGGRERGREEGREGETERGREEGREGGRERGREGETGGNANLQWIVGLLGAL